MARIPNPHAAICSTCDELWSAKLGSLATNTVNLVAHVCVSLHIVFLNSTLNIVNDQLAFVVNSGDVADTDWRGFECSALEAKLFLPLRDESQVTSVELVDVKNALSRRALSEEHESGALWNPLHVERCESEALGGMLNDLGCFSSVHLNFKFPTIDSIIVLARALW